MQAHDTDRIKNDDRDYSVQCVQCGRRFEATRSDASFCSAACRVAYGREAEKFEQLLKQLDNWGISLAERALRYKKSKRMFDALTKIHRRIGNAIAEFEVNESA